MFARVCLLLVLLLGMLRTSAAFAQAAPPAAPLPPLMYAPSLQVAPLRCPECECDQARDDLIALKGEYARVHRLASTKSPRLMMLGGFIGAGAAVLATAFGARQIAITNDGQTRLIIFGAGATVVGLAVGMMGLHRYRKREREAEPYVERDKELRFAVQDAKLMRREACRGVPRGR